MALIGNITSGVSESLQRFGLIESSSGGEVTEAVSEKFDQLLRAFLAPSKEGKICEEELFSALVRERVLTKKGEDFAANYDQVFAANKRRYTKPDGFVAYEAAAVETLKELVRTEALSESQGNKIYSDAFSAAQLDSNTDKLWDIRGGKNDPTMSLELMETALLQARAKLESFAAATESAPARTLMDADDGQRASGGGAAPGTATGTAPETGAIAPRGTVIDGPNGFLFKPVSSNEGRLAVLLPESMAHLVEQVLLKTTDGKVLEQGRSVSFGEDGSREKFSFSKVGGAYPKNLRVEVHLEDGTIATYEIPDPSQRYD